MILEIPGDHDTVTKYEFVRDSEGLGSWVCISGKIPGNVGWSSSNMVVGVEHGKDLTEHAILLGLGSPEDFSCARVVRAKPAAKHARASSPEKAGKKTKIHSGKVNPFELMRRASASVSAG